MTLASSGDDRTIQLWDVESGANTATLTGHKGRIRSLSFSPDGTTIATGGRDKTIRLWDVATGKNFATLPGLGGVINSVTFSPDGTVIAGGDGSNVGLWYPPR